MKISFFKKLWGFAIALFLVFLSQDVMAQSTLSSQEIQKKAQQRGIVFADPGNLETTVTTTTLTDAVDGSSATATTYYTTVVTLIEEGKTIKDAMIEGLQKVHLDHGSNPTELLTLYNETLDLIQ